MLYCHHALIAASKTPVMLRHFSVFLDEAAELHRQGEAFVLRTQSHVPGVLGPAAVLRRLRRCQLRVFDRHFTLFQSHFRAKKINVNAYFGGNPSDGPRPVDTEGALSYMIWEALKDLYFSLEEDGRKKSVPRPAGLRHLAGRR